MQGCVKACPACPHRDLTLEESLSKKAVFLNDVLSGYKDGLLNKLSPNFLSVISKIRSTCEERRWHYRERTLLRAQRSDTHWNFGLIVGREKEFVSIPNCPVHSLRINQVFKLLAESLPQKEFPLAFVSINGGLVTLVLKTKNISPVIESQLLAPDFRSLLEQSGVTGLFLNFHPSCGNRVFATRGWRHLWGAEKEYEDGVAYGPSSFRQLIGELHRESLDAAQEFLSPSKDHLVLDLYCGSGASMKRWEPLAEKVLGVEIAGAPPEQSSILRGSVEDRLPQLDETLQEHSKILIYTNPSRLGMGHSVTTWIGKRARPQRIAYLSCNPLSLREDLAILLEAGYRLKRIIPYDFIPQTSQVESLTLLEL